MKRMEIEAQRIELDALESVGGGEGFGWPSWLPIARSPNYGQQDITVSGDHAWSSNVIVVGNGNTAVGGHINHITLPPLFG